MTVKQKFPTRYNLLTVIRPVFPYGNIRFQLILRYYAGGLRLNKIIEIFVWSPYLQIFASRLQRYDNFKLIRITCQAACHGKTEHGIFVKFKQTSQNCCRPSCRCHHLGYSACPRHFTEQIWCRSTFDSRGPGLSKWWCNLTVIRPVFPFENIRFQLKLRKHAGGLRLINYIIILV